MKVPLKNLVKTRVIIETLLIFILEVNNLAIIKILSYKEFAISFMNQFYISNL